MSNETTNNATIYTGPICPLHTHLDQKIDEGFKGVNVKLDLFKKEHIEFTVKKTLENGYRDEFIAQVKQDLKEDQKEDIERDMKIDSIFKELETQRRIREALEKEEEKEEKEEEKEQYIQTMYHTILSNKLAKYAIYVALFIGIGAIIVGAFGQNGAQMPGWERPIIAALGGAT